MKQYIVRETVREVRIVEYEFLVEADSIEKAYTIHNRGESYLQKEQERNPSIEETLSMEIFPLPD